MNIIEGEFVEKSPAHLIVQAGHLAYYIHISVFTYSQISNLTSRKDLPSFCGQGGCPDSLWIWQPGGAGNLSECLSQFPGWEPIRHV